MPDEKLPLILQPASSLARAEPQNGRIMAEMVSGALSNARQQRPSAQNLTSEQWFQRGESFYYGRKNSQSYAEASTCYRNASEKGHFDAKCNLGVMLTLGLGGPRNLSEAFCLFESAAKLGHVVAMLNLSYLYGAGIGVDFDARKQMLYEYHAMHKNDPTKWSNMLLSKWATAADLTMTDEMCRYDSRFRFDPKRTDEFITFYELVLPTRNSIVRLDEQGSVSILRKVRLDELTSSERVGRILVVDSVDSPLTCGDLIELPVFDAIAHWVVNQGGKPAEGVVMNPGGGEIQIPNANRQTIVGGIHNNLIELEPRVQDLAHSQAIISSFYQRGLGVHQNDVEALRWHALASGNGFFWQ
jgi:TPR repeat protein